ncbi:MAG: secreted trypsin-like serine protease [Alteromonadaceae bacterium]|jgi:secreted trypsin-like serine protease
MLNNNTKTCLALLPLLVTMHSYAGKNLDKNSGKLHHQRGTQQKIIGGEPVKVGDYNYMTSLQRDGQHFCGASFLGGKWVLTAAHCVDGKGGSGDGLEVLIGANDFTDSNSGKRVAVKRIYVHPEYNTPVDTNNDMTLLELETEVASPAISVVPKEIADVLTSGTMLTVTGWGNTLTDGENYPDKLMFVQVPLVTNDVCNLPASYDGGITEAMICAGNQAGGKDSCQGDSGGPLVYKHNNEYLQIGVVSFGEGCAQADKYGVYAAAFNFHEWITSVTKGVNIEDTLSFGAIEEGAEVKKSISISNNGNTEIKLSDFVISGDGSSQITIDSSTCSAIAAQAHCSLTLTYKASSSLGDDIKLTINTDSQISPLLNSKISAKFLKLAAEEIIKATDGKDIVWYNDESSPWILQSTDIKVGDNAIQAGTIGDNESSQLMAKVTGPAKLLFQSKTSTEQGYDFFDVFLDGKRAFYVSGKNEHFEGRFIDIPDGEHRVTFVYLKDDEQSDGNDTVYLDGFERLVKSEPIVLAPVVTPAVEKVIPKSSNGGSFGYLLSGFILFIFITRKIALFK